MSRPKTGKFTLRKGKTGGKNYSVFSVDKQHHRRSQNTSVSLATSNPRYRNKTGPRNLKKTKTIGAYNISLTNMSVDGTESNYSVITVKDTNELTGDEHAKRIFKAKQKGKPKESRSKRVKALRKRGELIDGQSSVAMKKYQQSTSGRKKKTGTKGTLLFRKLRDMSKTKRKRRIIGSLKKSPSKKNSEENEFIIEALKTIALWSNFSTITLNNLAKAMPERSVKAGTVICQQNEYGDEMYIVFKGEVSVINEEAPDNERKKTSMGSSGSKNNILGVGTAFGELGMYYGSSRERTIKARTDCRLFVLQRQDFTHIYQNEEWIKNDLMSKALLKVRVLEALPEEQLAYILDKAELMSFTAGTKIIEKGTLGGTFYMIDSGKVECQVFEKKNTNNATQIENRMSRKPMKSNIFKKNTSQNKESVSLHRRQNTLKRIIYSEGDYFGERALLQDECLRKADVIALTNVRVLAIDYESFANVKNFDGLKETFEENIRRQALIDTPFFDNLSKEEERQLEDALVLQEFPDGTLIIKEGTDNEKFYIILEGKVEVTKSLNSGKDKGFEVATLQSENYFGEGSLLLGKKTNASVTAKGKLSCYVLDKQKFTKLVKGEKIESLKKAYNERNRLLQIKSRAKKNEFLEKSELTDLKTVTTLGSGCFGLVTLVEVKGTASYFALKAMEKGAILRNNQKINIMNEKNLLLLCDHPFIVKLYRTFKDKKCVYFLMEYVQGGEMFQFLHHVRNGYLDNDTARFFVACVVDAFDYLHKKRILYRDLKPENLMIDLDGYTKVIDFGFAKKWRFRTFILCGTAQYLAPEILFHKGYGKSVDFWTLGILIYELFTGTTPFKRRERDDMFKAIKTENKIKFSSRRWKNASEAKQMVCKLLHKHPGKRLGCNGATSRGFKDVKEHDWFKSIDFQKLYFKELTPPWLPKVTDAQDFSNFEEYDEDENPLTGRYDDRIRGSSEWADF